MKLRCVVIDDEPIARKGMEEYVADVPYLSHVGSFESAADAKVYLSDHPVDLMLLDIRMPKQSGIDFLKELHEPPLVIFTTAYPQHALESYELNVIDYLVKPISPDRFKKATQKAFDYFQLKNPQTVPDFFFIKSNHQLEKISFSEVLFVEAMQNYCVIHTPSRKLICYITLTAMLEKLPADRFMKVHKSFIVALDKVTGIEGSSLKIGSLVIPTSRSLKALLTERITGKTILKR
ncbi:MAG: LytTR family two component transcriptional regulator [Bacteroidetes bacterium OLB12]|nr:MAG: LytTR family two component transcriptional regulator [Bacteroidetes bacterium OLB12]